MLEDEMPVIFPKKMPIFLAKVAMSDSIGVVAVMMRAHLIHGKPRNFSAKIISIWWWWMERLFSGRSGEAIGKFVPKARIYF